ALLAALFRVERWDPRALPYVLLALLGALVVVTRGDFSRLTVLTADARATLLMLGCLVMVAAFSLGAKRLLATVAPLPFVTLACTGGALFLLAAAALTGQAFLPRLVDLPPTPRWALFYLVAVNTIGTEWMSMTGIRRLPILVIAVFNYLQPPLVALFSLLVPGTGASLGWPMVIGGLAILCGASAVGTMRPGSPPWPEALLRRLRTL
ncbi:MAG TPA: EamA family transporter, partial [bacterium]|nr:EamA family transporter [bacterium]